MAKREPKQPKQAKREPKQPKQAKRRARRRPLLRHVQQALALGDVPRKRKPGAGRPKKGARASEKHKRRQELKPTEPVHVVIRAAGDIRSLRRRHIYKAIRGAIMLTFKRSDFRVVHLSIQGTHIHFLVEADDKYALAEGMKALQTSAARRINAAISKRTGTKRTGSVFPDRYHPEILRSPRQTRNALAYVLNNWRKHREDRNEKLNFIPCDLFSTGITFDGWCDLDVRTLNLPALFEPMASVLPQTWLLSVGWKRAGTISTRHVPSSAPTHLVE